MTNINKIETTIFDYLVLQKNNPVCSGEIYNYLIKNNIIDKHQNELFKELCFKLNFKYSNISKILCRESLYLMFSTEELHICDLIKNKINSDRQNILLYNASDIIKYSIDSMILDGFDVNLKLDNLGSTLLKYILSENSNILAEFLTKCCEINLELDINDDDFDINEINYTNSQEINSFLISNYKNNINLKKISEEHSLLKNNIKFLNTKIEEIYICNKDIIDEASELKKYVINLKNNVACFILAILFAMYLIVNIK